MDLKLSYMSQMGVFCIGSLGWPLRNARSYCRYLQVSTDFPQCTGYGLGGVGSHMGTIWRQEIELFSNENIQILANFSDFGHFS